MAADGGVVRQYGDAPEGIPLHWFEQDCVMVVIILLSLSLSHLDEGVLGDDDGSTIFGMGIASCRNRVTTSDG